MVNGRRGERVRAPQSAAFQAQNSDGMIYVGTAYCSTTSENRVYGINATSGAAYWSFNNPGGVFDMDTVHGMLLDRANDVLYVTTDRRLSSTQHSVWAIDVLTGAKLWSVSAGMAKTNPVQISGCGEKMPSTSVAPASEPSWMVRPSCGDQKWHRASGMLRTPRRSEKLASTSPAPLRNADITSSALHATSMTKRGLILGRLGRRRPVFRSRPDNSTLCQSGT